MAKEIEFPQAKGSALSKPPSAQFLTWLVGQLAKLAMARQATIDTETLKFFAVSLSGFQTTDLYLAIDRLCHTRRAEGETAFPDLPTIEEAVFAERNMRLRIIREEEDRRYLDAQEKHRAEHPEEYVTMSEIFAAVRARRAAKTKAEVKQMPKKSKK